MFLSAVLFVLFVAGCWLYCLTDAALTPPRSSAGLRKPVWIALIAVTFILGAIAWVIARKPWPGPAPAPPGGQPGRRSVRRVRRAETSAGTRRIPRIHGRRVPFRRGPWTATRPAGPNGRPQRSGPIGPDDDPEFLRLLDRLISGNSDAGE